MADTIHCSKTIIFPGASTSGAELEPNGCSRFYETRLVLKDIQADMPLSAVHFGFVQVLSEDFPIVKTKVLNSFGSKSFGSSASSHKCTNTSWEITMLEFLLRGASSRQQQRQRVYLHLHVCTSKAFRVLLLHRVIL